jgi:hypothetical protein
MFGMLRYAQHERKIISDIQFSPFVLSAVEGSERIFRNLLGSDVSDN